MSPAFRWVRTKLFPNWFESVVTLSVAAVCLWAVFSFFGWGLGQANWLVVWDNLKVLLVGLYPPELVWKAWLFCVVVCSLCAAAAGKVLGSKAKTVLFIGMPILLLAGYLAKLGLHSAGSWLAICAISFMAAWYLSSLKGRINRYLNWCLGIAALLSIALLVTSGVKDIGGLLLGVLLTMATSVLVIPFGVLLALGRQSRYASVRICCSAFIETIRSVPLILVVYAVWIMLPLVFPSFPIPDIYRGIIGFVIFYSAYSAEFVRSGLQSIPRGQIEAAQSLGLNDFDTKTSVVLPQAMRVAIPALAGNILDIFNFAPLVFIIGLTEFLRAGQLVLSNPQYSGSTYEIYVFMFVVYFVIGSLLTFFARRLELQYSRGAR